MKDIKIDPVDKSILQVLQRKGRAMINEVSDMVGLGGLAAKRCKPKRRVAVRSVNSA